MTVTDLISFALLACASWRLVDATRTLRRVRAMHAAADRRLNAAAEYAEQVRRNAAHLARIMHPSTRPAIAVGGDGRLTVDWPDPDITEVVISRDALAGLIRDLNAVQRAPTAYALDHPAWIVAAHLARIMHPSTRPAIAVGGDGRLTVDWPDPDITEVVISRDALAGLIRDLNATRGH